MLLLLPYAFLLLLLRLALLALQQMLEVLGDLRRGLLLPRFLLFRRALLGLRLEQLLGRELPHARLLLLLGRLLLPLKLIDDGQPCRVVLALRGRCLLCNASCLCRWGRGCRSLSCHLALRLCARQCAQRCTAGAATARAVAGVAAVAARLPLA